MNKDEISEYLSFVSHNATKYLDMDMIEISEIMNSNNELDKLVSRLRKSKADRRLIDDLNSCRIPVQTETKDFLYFVIYFVLLGWLFGLFSYKRRKQIESDKMKDQIQGFRLELIDISMSLDKYEL